MLKQNVTSPLCLHSFLFLSPLTFLPSRLLQPASTLMFSLPPSIYTSPSSLLSSPLSSLLSSPSHSLSLFPWQAGDWHLQITRRQWHCVWPLSLISSPPPFCHLITVNPRPAPHCCIFNMPAHPPHSLSHTHTHTHTFPLFHSPAAYFTCFSVRYLESDHRLYILPCSLRVFSLHRLHYHTITSPASSPCSPPLCGVSLHPTHRPIHVNLPVCISGLQLVSLKRLVNNVVRLARSIRVNENELYELLWQIWRFQLPAWRVFSS